MLNATICSKARLARDPRFDGKFFTAVKTTQIYCRSICPATPPLEKNVHYYATAIEAANAGYRPCLRCRPDSAPDSFAWKGVSTTLDRAIRLINEGALQEGSIEDLASRLGISARYLRQLFKKHLGISPKAYALYQQCLFAKQLLHQTQLPITQVALASGFNSIRRFNDYFQSQLHLSPSKVRQSNAAPSNTLQLKLYYRPPYNWAAMQTFLAARVIEGLEWCDEHSYGRTFEWLGTTGQFTAQHIEKENRFSVSIQLSEVTHLKAIVNNIRRILDIDIDIQSIEKDLQPYFSSANTFKSGLRLPGIWSLFEAGIRAILGQHISVVAAQGLVTRLVSELGDNTAKGKLFPCPFSILESSLDFLKMPEARKQTLKNLAKHYVENDKPNHPEEWLLLKGIGPWTVDYARLRGLSDPDIYLGGDLGVKKAMNQLDCKQSTEAASPWRSYLTMQLWSQL